MSNTSVAAALLPLTATFYRVSEFSLLLLFFLQSYWSKIVFFLKTVLGGSLHLTLFIF